MANQDHLNKLKEGVTIWNQWREEYPNIIPDLHGADLYRADLRGADLSGANLSMAHLSDTDLRQVDLSQANLSDALLSDALLSMTNLSGANLSGANFYRADLSDALLRGANLHGANLSETICWDTIFANIDLQTTEGLETINHNGPSTIGIDTIIHSQGKIPDIFLRKAGVPASIIEQIPSLIGSLEPIQYYSCFISYSSQDQPFAERLYADLQSKNVRCWYAPHHMKIGEKIIDRIDESIRLYDKLLLILSQDSVESHWVDHEVGTALDKEREGHPNILFPVRIDETIMSKKIGWANHIRTNRQIGDFTRWKEHDAYQQAFNRLLRDLKAQS